MKANAKKHKITASSEIVDEQAPAALQPSKPHAAPDTGREAAIATGDSIPASGDPVVRTVSSAATTVCLCEFVENPLNPSTATEADIERLAGKLKRVPLGLTAMRLAYCRDIMPGKLTVISGNKRLRVLKQAYGEDGEIPADWVQDVTAMSEAERHEFIITANTSDGEWNIDQLMADYDKAELDALMKPGEIDDLLAAVGTDAPAGDADMEEFDDLDNGDPAADEVKCMVGRTRIPITQEEADLLLARYQGYVERMSVGYGFFNELLGVENGDEHSA